jgi:oligopeptide/dipeptide ABC transporter ATP-binding protein
MFLTNTITSFLDRFLRALMKLEKSKSEILLKVHGLKKYFPVQRGFLKKTVGWIKAVDGVDLEVPQGKTLGLVGESGCGKSTVGKLILKLLEPTAGRIVYEDTDITDTPKDEMKPFRRKMQIIFQDPFGSLNPRMTAGQSIEEGLRTLGVRSRREREARVMELLDMVGINGSAADRYPHEFSGGQRQRIGVARALSVDPALIICDEPVSALDVSIQAQIINLLQELQDRLSLSYLFVAHDLNVVGYMSDRIAVMYLGHIMEYAPADVLFDDPLHPYTQALLSAVPSTERDRDHKWQALTGDVPSPFDPPPGCKFQGRCPLVEDRCRREEVGYVAVKEGHSVRCWKVAK